MKKILAVTPFTEEQKASLTAAAKEGGNEIVYAAPGDVTDEMLDSADALIGNLPVGRLHGRKNLTWVQLQSSGATEYALILYRDKLPKFRNEDENGVHRMIKNWFEWKKDGREIPRIHPAQKPVNLLRQLISIFTDPGDVVIDPCAGSGSTLRAARELGRNSYGFEIDRDFYTKAKEQMLSTTTTPPPCKGEQE